MASSRRCFFMHIPKTAGTTLRRELSRRFDPGKVLPTDWEVSYRWHGHYPTIPRLLKLRASRWRNAQFLRGHYPWQVSARFDKPPFMLTMLRDPIARSISQLLHVKRAAPWASTLSYEEILRQDGYVYSNLTNVQTKMLGMRFAIDDEQQWPQDISHPVHIDDEFYERALKTLDSFEFFGLQERFDESMAVLFDRLGFELPDHFERRNVGGPKPSMSDEVLDKLRAANFYDLKLYAHASAKFGEILPQKVQN